MKPAFRLCRPELPVIGKPSGTFLYRSSARPGGVRRRAVRTAIDAHRLRLAASPPREPEPDGCMGSVTAQSMVREAPLENPAAPAYSLCSSRQRHRQETETLLALMLRGVLVLVPDVRVSCLLTRLSIYFPCSCRSNNVSQGVLKRLG